MKTKKVILTVISAFLLTTFFACKQEDDDSSETLAAPTNLSVSYADITDLVKITWDTVDGASHYWIFYSTENDITKSDYHGGALTNSYKIKLSKSGTYYFWIKAANKYYGEKSVVESDFSTVQSFVFFQGTDASLTAPENLAVTLSSTTKNTVDLTWDAVEGIKYYWIYYSTTNDLSTATYYGYEYSDTETTVKLSSSGTYYFWVKSASSYHSDSQATSSDFSEGQSLTFSVETLTAPENLAVTLSGTTKNTVDLTWDSVEGIKYYWIYYSTTNDSSTATYYGYEYSDTKTTVTLLKSGAYYFWVKSASSYHSDSQATSSDFSTVQSIVFTHEELSAPTELKAEKYINTNYPGIKLSWTSSQSAYYLIYWATENDSSKAKEIITYSSSNQYTIYENVYNLESGTTYYFWVKSSDTYSGSNLSAFSDVVSITY